MKDHEIAALVNELVVTAQTFHMAGQLRERLRAIIHDPLKRISDLEAQNADLVRRLLADHQRVEPHHADQCALCREATAAIDGQQAAPVRIDIKRMQAALDSESIMFPPGLTRVGKAAFILNHAESQPAQGERQPDFRRPTSTACVVRPTETARGPQYGDDA